MGVELHEQVARDAASRGLSMNANLVRLLTAAVNKQVVDLPTSLLEQVQEEATAQGVSVETLIATLLAGSLGFALDGDTAA